MSLVLKGQILLSLCTCNILYTVLRTEAVRTEEVAAEDIILFTELVKLLFCVCVIFSSSEDSSAPGKYFGKLIWLVLNSAKMGVVALIYFVMNILSFWNFDYIGAGEFAVFAQAKILWTALFSVLLLGMEISSSKWRALVLLCIGCILVASPVYNTCENHIIDPKRSTDAESLSSTRFLKYTGYVMVIIQTVLSGVANIYFEKVVKSKHEIITIWERNFQLSFWSMLFCVFSKVYRRANVIDFDLSVWGKFSVASLALGVTNGLLIALTLKHCDSVIKTVAQSASIVFCTILGNLYQNEVMDSFVMMGCLVTIIAVSNYTFDVEPLAAAAAVGAAPSERRKKTK